MPLARLMERLHMEAAPPPVEAQQDYDARFVRLVLIAVVVGLLMSFSASYPLASSPNHDYIPGDATKFAKLHLFYALLGLGAMAVMSRLRPKTIEGLGLPAFGLSLLLMLATIVVHLAMGTSNRGSLIALDLGPLRFQPSELAKLCFVVYLASLLSQGPWEGSPSKSVRDRVKWSACAFCVLLVGQRDQGMMVLVFCIALAMCLLGDLPVWKAARSLLLAFGGALVLAMSSPERRERIWAWIHPEQYLDGAGGHILAMLVATSRGFLSGVGLGMSPEKWKQMPEPYTDSIFCVMGGEMGLVGCTLFLLLIGWLVYRCFEIGRWSRDSFGYFLATGVGLMYGIQALVNMFVATNMMPVTGLTLPFISYGGSSLVSCLMGAGLVLAVYRHNPMLRKE